MFALSSIGSSLSGLDHLATDERSAIQQCFTPTSSTDDDDDESSIESIYHDALAESSENELLSVGDAETCGGTILASLSSKEVRENLTAGLRAAEERKSPRVQAQAKHPLTRARNFLLEVATVPSDVLSFTPTMAEMALSRHIDVDTQSSCPTRSRSEAYNYQACHNTTDDSTGSSTYEKPVQNLQPERVACPFCDREKDLQWCLSSERKRSRQKDSAHGNRLIVVATIVAFLVAVVAFFLGKMVSDISAERAMAKYMAQCNEMIMHKEEDDLYWKLVSAAFSAIVNAVAGPVANFVVAAGKN